MSFYDPTMMGYGGGGYGMGGYGGYGGMGGLGMTSPVFGGGMDPTSSSSLSVFCILLILSVVFTAFLTNEAYKKEEGDDENEDGDDENVEDDEDDEDGEDGEDETLFVTTVFRGVTLESQSNPGRSPGLNLALQQAGPNWDIVAIPHKGGNLFAIQHVYSKGYLAVDRSLGNLTYKDKVSDVTLWFMEPGVCGDGRYARFRSFSTQKYLSVENGLLWASIVPSQSTNPKDFCFLVTGGTVVVKDDVATEFTESSKKRVNGKKKKGVAKRWRSLPLKARRKLLRKGIKGKLK